MLNANARVKIRINSDSAEIFYSLPLARQKTSYETPLNKEFSNFSDV